MVEWWGGRCPSPSPYGYRANAHPSPMWVCPGLVRWPGNDYDLSPCRVKDHNKARRSPTANLLCWGSEKCGQPRGGTVRRLSARCGQPRGKTVLGPRRVTRQPGQGFCQLQEYLRLSSCSPLVDNLDIWAVHRRASRATMVGLCMLLMASVLGPGGQVPTYSRNLDFLDFTLNWGTYHVAIMLKLGSRRDFGYI